MGYGVCVHIVYEHRAIFLYRPSGASRGKSVQIEAARRLYGNRAISVELPCSLRSLQTVIIRSPCGFHAEAARRWCGDLSATMQFSSVRSLCGALAGILRCHYDLSTGYGLYKYNFSNLYNFPLNKIVEAAEPVNPYKKSHSRLLPPHGGLAEATQKGEYGQDTGFVDSSQTKCELGISTELNKLHYKYSVHVFAKMITK